MKTKILFFISLLVITTSINSLAQDSRRNKKQNYKGEQPKQSEWKGPKKGKGESYNENINPSWKSIKFRKSPRVTVKRDLPGGRIVFRDKDRNYYFHDGRYYDYNNGRYISVVPPIGFRVRNLPFGFREFVNSTRTYFYFGGLFYILLNNEYEIVDPPVGAIVYDLPDDADRVQIEGRTYYQYNGTLYRRVVTPNGRAFKVVGKLME